MGAYSVIAVLVTCILFLPVVGADKPVQDCGRCQRLDTVDEEVELLYCRANFNPWDPPSQQDIQSRCNDCGGSVAVLSNENPYYTRRVGRCLERLGIYMSPGDELLSDDAASAWTGHLVVITSSWKLRIRIDISHVVGFLCNISSTDMEVTSRTELQTTVAEVETTTLKEPSTNITEPSTTVGTTLRTSPKSTVYETTNPTTEPTTGPEMSTIPAPAYVTTEEDVLFLNSGLRESQNALGHPLNGLYVALIVPTLVMVCFVVVGVIAGMCLIVKVKKRTPPADPLSIETGSPVDNPVYFSPQALTIGGKPGGTISFGSSLNEKALAGSLRKY